jgi:hypothetical protein
MMMRSLISVTKYALKVIGPGVYSASNRNKYRKHKKMYLGSKVRLVCGVDNLTTIYVPIV